MLVNSIVLIADFRIYLLVAELMENVLGLHLVMQCLKFDINLNYIYYEHFNTYQHVYKSYKISVC